MFSIGIVVLHVQKRVTGNGGDSDQSLSRDMYSNKQLCVVYRNKSLIQAMPAAANIMSMYSEKDE